MADHTCSTCSNPQSHWHCKVCGIQVPHTRGPIGMYCKQHKHNNPHKRRPVPITCKTCGQLAMRSKDTIYCSPACRPEPRAPRTQVTWRQCGACQRWLCRPGRKYCNTECTANANGYRNRPCRQCGTNLGEVSLVTYCEPCRQQRTRETRMANKRKRRAAKKNTITETINPIDIYERDGWRCGICHQRVNRERRFPHPKSASLDHIEALALGGTHTKANVQLAHLDCNIRKGNREPAQLMLIG